jgi:phosphoglucosamine mutase
LSEYFGTDGVRGRVGEAPMTVDFALRLASAAARVLAPEGGRVLIGKDTRVSGYMFESALEAGFVAAGVDVLLIGPLPTPGIAYMTQRLSCNFGVVISASHNGYEDNGIKFFDASGSKLSDDVERRIERVLHEPVITRESQRLGKAARTDKSRVHYQEFCASTIPSGMTLEGFKIVVDCANGAGYKVAPRIFADLGAEIVPIGCSPNGRNINDGCGSMAPELLQLTVPGVRAQVGLALDGDGDRVVMVDELGRCVDGDQLLYILARARRDAGTLTGPVVGTSMSNLGLELALGELGIAFRRAAVGDRHVLGMLQEVGGTLGGETSGHILCLDKTTTGDGLISALQVLAVMKSTGAGLAELCAPMPKFPQVILNVRVAQRFDPMASPEIAGVAATVERRFKGRGRIVLRPSGTEPVIRVMVEGDDAKLVKAGAREIAAVVESVAGKAAAALVPKSGAGLTGTCS